MRAAAAAAAALLALDCREQEQQQHSRSREKTVVGRHEPGSYLYFVVSQFGGGGTDDGDDGWERNKTRTAELPSPVLFLLQATAVRSRVRPDSSVLPARIVLTPYPS